MSYLLRVQRYDHINRFLKEVERETQIPNRCAQVQRPRKSDVPLPPDEDEIDDQIRVTLGYPDDYATSTRRQRYISLSRLFKSKIGRELGLADLLNDIPIPAKGKPRVVVLTAEEVDALVNAVETPQERALVYLLLHTGIRIGEVVGLKVSDIVDGELTVDGKTGPRPVTLQPEMEQMLRDLANEDGNIWWDDDGPLSLGQIEYRYRKIAKRAGIRASFSLGG